MNQVILSGYLSKEPEVKTLTDGKKVVSLQIAVHRKDKDKTSDFFNITAWGHNAEFLGKYFHKGDPAEVRGQLRTRKYEKDGETRSIVEIIVDDIGFVPSRKTDRPATPRNDEPSFEDMFL